MKITGTMINYYFHCKKQCYLNSKKINLEENSEDVLIGRTLHDNKYSDDQNGEIELENIKIDKITNDYVVEYKKSDSDINAVKWQLIYYLYKLKEKGINKKGKIIFEEAKTNRCIYIELTDEIVVEIRRLINEIEELLEKEEVPNIEEGKNCKKCAYYMYCRL